MSELLGQGRDADVFADGPHRVRRVYRDGRDATAEADVMRHLVAQGYPVPRVHDADGPTLVLDRVDGPTLADHAVDHPAAADDDARVLRALHDQLARVTPPPGLPTPFGPGDQLLHLDLQPYNVLLGADGPVVVDWTNAAQGPAPVDRAMTWVVLATAVVAPEVAVRIDPLRPVFLAALLDGDDDPARAWCAAAARRRLDHDRNTRDEEREALQRIARLTIA